MLSIIGKILEVVGKLVGLRSELERADKALRDKIADLFDQISDCLLRVATELRKEQVPHGACAELATYSVGIAVLISPITGQTEAMEISDKLREAHNVEGLLLSLREVPNPGDEIAKIEGASGEFKALANMLRATA